MNMVFYQTGDSSLIDATKNQGGEYVGVYSGDSLRKIRERYPRAELVDIDDALRQIDAAGIKLYKVGEAAEITEAEFLEMLEVLPPMHWGNCGSTESFKISEITSGDITACFVRIGKKYFRLNHKIHATHAELVRCCEVKK